MGKRAFTMVEIIVVMVMIAMIAAWGIPQYGRALNRARARTAIQNLSIIQAANMLYRVRNGGAATDNCTNDNACTDIGEINNMNGANSLSIGTSGVTYACGDGGTTCTGTITGLFRVTADLNSGATPTCAELGATTICP